MSVEHPSVPIGMERAPVNVDVSRWDQSTFTGRMNHFVRIVNPFLSLKTNQELDDAKTLVKQARCLQIT